MHDVDASFATLNNDLVKFKNWPINGNCLLNFDRNKQVQEFLSSKKIRKVFHPNLYFNDHSIETSVVHKYLGLTLDEKLIASVTKIIKP